LSFTYIIGYLSLRHFQRFPFVHSGFALNETM